MGVPSGVPSVSKWYTLAASFPLEEYDLGSCPVHHSAVDDDSGHRYPVGRSVSARLNIKFLKL